MPWPTCIVIGAAKCGTTTLYHAMNQHPQIHMSPIKVTRYFSAIGPNEDGKTPYEKSRFPDGNWISDMETYLGLFEAQNGEPVLGEASPFYIACDYAAINMRRHVPDARLIATLRDPAKRAFSDYQMLVRKGKEDTRDFRRVLTSEIAAMRAGQLENHSYIGRGLYFKQLSLLYESFPKDQVLVLLQEEMFTNYSATMAKVYRHVGADDQFVPAPEARNVGYAVRSVRLESVLQEGGTVKSVLQKLVPRKLRHRLYAKANSANRQQVSLDPETRAMMLPVFREDTLRLQDLLGRDLTKWLA